ncbi:M15 family metallopeptidase [Vibrio makurazakiensis]|uniref:M15 family metallopeptidase n=1 Tax=Vibrio makurazakiensis TaxID=2910250 RepID=UPI003D096A29
MTPEQLTGQVDSHLITSLIGDKHFLIHPDVEKDLHRLVTAAQEAGFKLEIASGYRNFERQSAIWNGKFSGKRVILDSNSQEIDPASLSDEQKLYAILRWSALPGASRHHWGCEFDVFARNLLPQGSQLQLEPWEYFSGHQQEFYLWLKANLNSYGFFFPYSSDLGGVAIEPWHISHRETSSQCLSQLSKTVLESQLAQQPILGQGVIIKNMERIYTRFIININD